jgi:putative endonuclease
MPSSFNMAYFVYILKSLKDETYYIGSTQDLNSRIERHNQGRVSCTKPRCSWKLGYAEEHPDRSSAVKKEYEIKKGKSREFIETLIKTSQNRGFGKIATNGYLRTPHYLLTRQMRLS